MTMSEPEITDENTIVYGAGSFNDRRFDNLEPYILKGSVTGVPDLPWIGSFGNDRLICVRVRTPPNWFHRQMQRLLLGIKWEKYDE